MIGVILTPAPSHPYEEENEGRVRLESGFSPYAIFPRSDSTVLLGNGNVGYCSGVVRSSLPLSKEPELETPAVYWMDRSLSYGLPRVVFNGFELMCS